MNLSIVFAPALAAISLSLWAFSHDRPEPKTSGIG